MKFLKKKKKYPTQWMLKDKKIKENLEKFSKVTKIFNFLEKERIKLQLFGHSIDLKDKRHYINKDGKKYEHIPIIANKHLYKRLGLYLNCSANHARKYFYFLKKIEAINFLYNDGRYNKIYSIGYFIKTKIGDEYMCKGILFLKKDKKTIENLRNIQDLIF